MLRLLTRASLGTGVSSADEDVLHRYRVRVSYTAGVSGGTERHCVIRPCYLS